MKTGGEGTASREAALTFECTCLERAPVQRPALQQEGGLLGELMRFCRVGDTVVLRFYVSQHDPLWDSLSPVGMSGTRASERLRSQRTSHASCPLRPLVGVPRDLPRGAGDPAGPCDGPPVSLTFERA